MKRYLVIVATLTALALPARVGAEEATAPAVERGWVSAAELTNLLVGKGLITPREQKSLTHSTGAASADGTTSEKIFRTEPYRAE
jgi:hypothetical protein